jgi:DinB superfamily
MTRRRLLRAHDALLASLDLEIEQASDPASYEASAPAVSKWSVKDHLEHLSIANGGIVSWIERARDGDPDLDTGGGPNLAGRIVLLLGAFPRGRGKAPERTLPRGTSAEELTAKFRGIGERVKALEGSLAQIQASRATRNHFAFGNLNAAQWLQFAVIHDNHHQKIIRDVLKASADRSAAGAP